MEWLLGALVGGFIGLISALIASEYTAWRKRTITARNMARSLRSEIAFSKSGIREIEKELEKAMTDGRAGTSLVKPFPRDAFNASAGDLGLLPRTAVESVHRFYNNIAGIEFIVREAYLLYTRYPAQFQKPPRDALAPFHKWLKDATKATLHAADEAIAALDHIAVERRYWRQRIVRR